ncbi:MAG: hypothetical protein PVF43_03570 [Candidatus Eiseniibacteriota bacterium]
MACSTVLVVVALGLGVLVPPSALARSEQGFSPTVESYYAAQQEEAGKDGGPQGIFERSCSFIHSAGNLLLHMSNGGFVGDYFGRFCSRPSCEWPPGSNHEYLFMGGLWVGALDPDGNPRVTTGAYETEFLPDFTDPLDRIYTSLEGALNGARYSLSGDATSADDDGDATGPTDRRHINEDFLNGRDDDGDGLIDEDFEAISQQMFASQYTDYGEVSTNIYAEHVPLNLRVQQRSFAWSSGGAENMIGIDYTIWNDGGRPLRDLYLGFFVDSDIGPADDDLYPNMFQDDLVAFSEIDTTINDERPGVPAECRQRQVKLQLAYMRDVPDSEHSFTETGDVPGWFGGLFLGHSTDPEGLVAPEEVGIRTFVWFTQGGAIRDPENDFERYELLSRNSRTDDGLFIQENPTEPRDYRYVMAVGPFAELLPDTFLTFQVAFVIGDGFEGANGLKRNAINAQRIFDGDLFNLDGDGSTGVDGKEKCVFCGGSGPLSTIDADCDSETPEIECLRNACTWIDGDCANPAHRCTGRDGREGRVNWIGVSPPPPPSITIHTADGLILGEADDSIDCLSGTQPEAGAGEVLIAWNDDIDATTNPITGEKNFTGYRIWKAAGWTRESESVPTELFQLLGDFSAEGDSSCVRLGAYPRDATPSNAATHPPIYFDYCRPSTEAFEYYLSTIDPADSPCPLPVLDGRPLPEEKVFDVEGPDAGYDVTDVFNNDIGSCPLSFLVDRTVGYRVDVSSCSEQSLPVARPNPELPGSMFPGGVAYQIEDSTFTVCDTVWCKGFYRYRDTEVLDGYPYFYMVTAYSKVKEEGPTGTITSELHTRPAGSQEQVIFPTWDAASNLDDVKVVPNPYLRGAGWDLNPSPSDPTGTRIAFTNLPAGSTIRIFTLAGDLVEILTPDSQDGGANYWDLISRNGQDIVSGIYLYSVESPLGTKVGKFVVVRN